MKKGKRLFAIFAFVMLGLFAFAFTSVTKVHAEPTTFDFSTGTNDSDAKTNLWSDDVLTILQEKGTSTNEPGDYVSSPRWYANHIITFTPKANYTITSITITCSGTKYVDSSPTWSKGTSSTDNLVISWIGSESNAFTLVPSKQIRPTQLTYTYVETINPTSVSISDTLELNVGTTSTLTATVLPENASNKIVNWSSSDETIATVDANGVVSGVKAGTATITATINNTEISDTCTVTIKGAPASITSFVNSDLQEQLAFHYEYENEVEIVSTPEESVNYYLGNIFSNDTYFVSSTSMTSSSDLSSAIKFNIISHSTDDDGHSLFYLVSGTKYFGQGSSTTVASSTKTVAEADTENKYLWYIDNENIINKYSSRFLGFTNSTYSQVKAYASQNLDSYEKVHLLSTGDAVTFTDKASNENAVTMRIGYTMSKTMYNAIKELDSNAEFGVYLNNTHYEPCNPVEADENTYRFYVAVNGITASNFDTVLTASGYVSVNNTVYYTTDVNEYSVKTLALEYITNHLDNEQVAAAKYALTYLAYNA